MLDDRSSQPNSPDAERDRVARDIAGRLFTRGVDVRDDDSNDDVTAMEEAVERFESRVQAAGGDLMVDEPPRGQKGQPDVSRFRLPLRRALRTPALHDAERDLHPYAVPVSLRAAYVFRQPEGGCGRTSRATRSCSTSCRPRLLRLACGPSPPSPAARSARERSRTSSLPCRDR